MAAGAAAEGAAEAARHGFHGVCISTATTTSQASVIGMKTFQPSRMI